MNITYDPVADAMYIYFTNKKTGAKTEEIRKDLLLDLDKKGRMVGIEILEASEKMPRKDLKSFSLLIPTYTSLDFLSHLKSRK